MWVLLLGGLHRGMVVDVRLVVLVGCLRLLGASVASRSPVLAIVLEENSLLAQAPFYVGMGLICQKMASSPGR